jgi:outer membrane lipoprotein carrier protein
MQYLDSDLKSSGKFWYVYPDKVRWEYLKPYEYIIILNKEKISLISTNSTNEFEVNSNETFKKMNEMIVSAVSGKVFDNSEYQTKMLENKEFYKVTLQPVSQEIKKMIERLELYFDKNNYTIVKLKIIEPTSDYSLIHFSNQILNEPIPEHIFIP